MSQMNNFAETVARKRKEKNMTQEALAKQLGISPQAVSKWENGLGLPDVTLFPALAEALEVSLAELFGVEEQNSSPAVSNMETTEQGKSRVPKLMGGLPLAGVGSRRACYSAKPVVEQKGEKLFFGDGSEADLDGGWSTNCGEGEMRIYKIEEIGHFGGNPDDREDSLVEKEWKDFPKTIRSLYLSIPLHCVLRIVKGGGDTCRLHIKGRKRYLNAIMVENDGETLTVRGKSLVNWTWRSGDQCAITLYVPFEKGQKLHASLYGSCSAAVECDFEEGELKITGSGSFTVRSFEKSLTASISGSGTVKGGDSLGSTKLRVSGSGDIRLGRMNNPDIKISGSGDAFADCASGKSVVRISGSGDVRVKEIHGELDVKISGSGDLSCAGELDKLSFTSSGSGDLKAKNLTVKDAELHTMGNADIEIGRITGSSREKFSKQTSVKIGSRG